MIFSLEKRSHCRGWKIFTNNRNDLKNYINTLNVVLTRFIRLSTTNQEKNLVSLGHNDVARAITWVVIFFLCRWISDQNRVYLYESSVRNIQKWTLIERNLKLPWGILRVFDLMVKNVGIRWIKYYSNQYVEIWCLGKRTLL